MFAQAPPKEHHSIEKAQITWPATKTQMFAGVLLIVISSFLAYGSTLKMGFLLDDYLHLDYSARALNGEFGPLTSNLFSNWGGSDIMKSYRPVVSLSIFIDYLLFHIHASGYHFTNIIIFCCCSVMVALITLEITARLGSRSGALSALWAGLLFSVYPLHCESVAWIIGRVDTLATAFYLASLYCFLRLELLKEKAFVGRSLLFFVLALASKETAVSLPAAIALLALLPPSTIDSREKEASEKIKFGSQILSRLKHSFIATLPYAATLIIFAVIRQLLIGTTIGGYGGGTGGSGLADILHSFKIFGDRDSLTKIFIPISEEYLPVRSLALFCTVPVIGALTIFLLKQLVCFARDRQKGSTFSGAIFTPLAAFIWLALALLPAFQIWHIYPNLVGSRLFFLSSVGLCISLSLLALPTLERALPTRIFSIFTVIGTATLCTIYFVWFYALQIDLLPWQKASALMVDFESQLKEKIFSTASKKVVVLNLPQDYKGAGMLGRKLYLDISNRPPFLGSDLSARLAVLEPRITGSRDYIWPGELAAAESDTDKLIVLWSNSDATLHTFNRNTFDRQANKPKNETKLSLTKSLDTLPTIATGKWQSVEKAQPVLKRLTGGWAELSCPDRTESKKTDLILWLDQTVDPADQNNRLLTLDVQDDQDIGMTSRCQILWRKAGESQNLGVADAFIDRHEGKDSFDRYVFDLGRYRSYLLNAGSVQIGLRFDLNRGPVTFMPESLKMVSADELIPAINLAPGGKAIFYDVSKLAAATAETTIRSAEQLQFFVTDVGVTTDPATELDLYQPAAIDKSKPALTLPLTADILKGEVALSELAKNIGPEQTTSSAKNKIRQIVLRLVSADGKVKSLCSQPVTVSADQ